MNDNLLPATRHRAYRLRIQSKLLMNDIAHIEDNTLPQYGFSFKFVCFLSKYIQRVSFPKIVGHKTSQKGSSETC